MSEQALHFPLLVGLVGVVIVLIMWMKAGLHRIGVPALVGYLGLGLALRVSNDRFGLLGGGSQEVFAFLGKVGLVTLLFRVGLESKLKMLVGQLRRASVVWLGNVLVSGILGFVAAFHVLGLTLVASLVVATALTATSVGISVAVWEERRALKSANGSMLVDVAELDDISAIVLMALLFAVIPVLGAGPHVSLGTVLVTTGGIFLAKLVGFGVFCLLFSRFLEHPLTRYFRRFERAPDPMLTLVGIGLMVSALAGVIGFSLAIGAFFAGLLFSRDPQAGKMESSFLPVYELFSPFFFIAIGMSMDIGRFGTASGMGAVLFCAAVLGKLLGDGVPMALMKGRAAGLLIGVSMVPRAEIAMVIMQRGLDHGSVPPQVFTGMVLVSAATCLLAPVGADSMLRRWPQEEKRR